MPTRSRRATAMSACRHPGRASTRRSGSSCCPTRRCERAPAPTRRCSPSCRARTRRGRTAPDGIGPRWRRRSPASLDPSFGPGLYRCARSNAGRRTMVRGAVLFNFHEALKVEALELKPPRADEVVVKVAASGVCHSDLSVQQMKLPVPPPAVLGHEGAGIVEEVGKDVTTLKKGDHGALPWGENCGRCHYCIAGTVHLCDRNMEGMMTAEDNISRKGDIDIARMAGVGSFADHTVVRATAAIKIPDEVPLDRACLVGCGVMAGGAAGVNTAKVRPGETVAVFGCGGVGLNVIQGAALSGASRIIAVDLSKSQLALAK